jgi:hypothetical protein
MGTMLQQRLHGFVGCGILGPFAAKTFSDKCIDVDHRLSIKEAGATLCSCMVFM